MIVAVSVMKMCDSMSEQSVSAIANIKRIAMGHDDQTSAKQQECINTERDRLTTTVTRIYRQEYVHNQVKRGDFKHSGYLTPEKMRERRKEEKRREKEKITCRP